LGTSKEFDGFPRVSHEPGAPGRLDPRRWPASAWSLLALAFGLSLTLWSAHLQQARRIERRDEVLAQAAETTFVMLGERLRDCERLLRAMQTAYHAGGDLSPEAYAQAYRNLRPIERFPSLQALAYARLDMRSDGPHYITTRIAPIAGNTRLTGLDLASQPANLAAALRARDSDEAALSPPFRLVQAVGANGPIDGFVMRLPVYAANVEPQTLVERRASTRGSLAASFRAGPLIDSAVPPTARALLHVEVSDISGAAPQLLYDSAPHERAHTKNEPVFERALHYGGRAWQVRMHPGAHAMLPMDWTQSIVFSGLIASLLLALLAGSVANTRQRALELGTRMSRRYRESEERFRTLNELLPALVVVARRSDGHIVHSNQAARLRLGHDLDTATLPVLFEDESLRERLLQPGQSECVNAEAQLRTTAGDRFWASVSIAEVVLDDEPRLLMVASDISEQRQLTELLSYQASHDALTELFNRREFERRVEHAMARNAAGGPACALLFVDLDQFKLINDTSGHIAGDQLLAQIGALMRDELRGGDVLARLGGDEFGVLATSVADVDEARMVAERMRKRIDGHVFVWDTQSYAVTASIGGAMLNDPSTGLKELFARADSACYMAKDAGRNRVHFYSESDSTFALRRSEMEWANRLRWAVDEGRLLLMYQEVWPLAVDLEGGARIELLLRFRELDGRIIAPGAFIPAAERYGLMPLIDRWVIETTLANFDRLHPSGGGLALATINLSGASIEDEALSSRILELLAEHRIDPKRVCFEITETVAVRNMAQVIQFVARLREAGCSIALDDFGAGMSSFGYLKNLPVDIIKIDGSFIQDVLTDPMSQSIVRAVTDIGHRRGFKVIAEWVSGHDVGDLLAAMGVDYGQGFGLHRPEIVSFQRTRSRLGAQS